MQSRMNWTLTSLSIELANRLAIPLTLAEPLGATLFLSFLERRPSEFEGDLSRAHSALTRLTQEMSTGVERPNVDVGEGSRLAHQRLLDCIPQVLRAIELCRTVHKNVVAVEPVAPASWADDSPVDRGPIDGVVWSYGSQGRECFATVGQAVVQGSKVEVRGIDRLLARSLAIAGNKVGGELTTETEHVKGARSKARRRNKSLRNLTPEMVLEDMQRFARGLKSQETTLDSQRIG